MRSTWQIVKILVSTLLIMALAATLIMTDRSGPVGEAQNVGHAIRHYWFVALVFGCAAALIWDSLQNLRKSGPSIAKIPEDEFEAATEGKNPATITKLRAMALKVRRVQDITAKTPGYLEKSANVKGAIRDAKRDFKDVDPQIVALEVHEWQVDNLRQDIAGIVEWLLSYSEALRRKKDAA